MKEEQVLSTFLTSSVSRNSGAVVPAVLPWGLSGGCRQDVSQGCSYLQAWQRLESFYPRQSQNLTSKCLSRLLHMGEWWCWLLTGGLNSSPHMTSPQGCLRALSPEWPRVAKTEAAVFAITETPSHTLSLPQYRSLPLSAGDTLWDPLWMPNLSSVSMVCLLWTFHTNRITVEPRFSHLVHPENCSKTSLLKNWVSFVCLLRDM